MKIIRVFPTRTTQSPIDNYAFFGVPTMFLPPHDAVHISTIFTWDIPKAMELKWQWEAYTNKPIIVGGPAFGMRGEAFIPGLYTMPGVTITSRGCPNKCWFCSVWKREGDIRELEIKDGWIVQDDNLLACSRPHIEAVFAMLQRQRKAAEFLGGLEAKLLRGWHIDLMLKTRIKQMFFAYDTKDDLDPLIQAGKMLTEAGYNSNKLRCFVLIGQPGDTYEKAERRLREAWAAGFLPDARLYRNNDGKYDLNWRRFSRIWARPAATKAILKEKTRRKDDE